MKYVLIGNSAAAVACVEGIRQRDREGDITMVTNSLPHLFPAADFLFAGGKDGPGAEWNPGRIIFMRKTDAS